MERININFYLNGKKVNTEVTPYDSALSVIRKMGYTGPKEGCGEGDCGACTVLLGRLKKGKPDYVTITSCIYPAVRLNGKHVVTPEGLAENGKLHRVQQLVLENHATQCGYCTPGIVMSMFGYLFSNGEYSKDGLEEALEGNLCRCTGYVSVKKAGEKAVSVLTRDNLEVPGYLQNSKEFLSNGKVLAETYKLCTHLQDLSGYDAGKGDVLANGGTDLMIAIKHRGFRPVAVYDISSVDELDFIKHAGNEVVIGGTTTLSEVRNSPVIQSLLPELAYTLSRMASLQIRNVATLAGNIANASPIADSTAFLMAAGAMLTLYSTKYGQKRKINIRHFFKAYKKTDLKNDEIIYSIHIPLRENMRYSFEKSSKRFSVDISTVNSALAVSVNNGEIRELDFSVGGVAPVPLFCEEVSQQAKGMKLTKENIELLAEEIGRKISPISDIRGSAEYRTELVRNHFKKHFYKLFPEIF